MLELEEPSDYLIQSFHFMMKKIWWEEIKLLNLKFYSGPWQSWDSRTSLADSESFI